MIPSTRVTVHHGRSFEELLTVWLAALAFERVVRVTGRLSMVLEELAQTVESEMTFHILGRIDDARG